MSRYAPILAALITHLKTFPGWADADCAYPNRPFDPAGRTTGYWKVALLPSGVDAALGASGSTHERGTFQVSRFEPGQAGESAALVAVDSMFSHLDRKTLTGTGVTVQTLVPTVGVPIPEPGWLQVPVSVSFLAS